jgi:uncharacterized protein (DUF1810 family)
MALDRFVTAQDGVHDRALQELRDGRKTSHWMWFVFPQIAGLGRSPTAQHYAIRDLGEAREYLAHPVLGPRLTEASQALLDLGTTDAAGVLGGIDAMKLRSSMTLFAHAGGDPVFRAVLDRFFGGEDDPETVRRLRGD